MKKISNVLVCILLLFILLFVIYLTTVYYISSVPKKHETIVKLSQSANPPISKTSASNTDSSLTSEEELSTNFNLIRNIRPNIIINPPDAKDLGYTSLYNIVKTWNPDEPDEPINFKETLQMFNYGDPYERAIAEKYRIAEIPFKVYNVSDFNRVSTLWSDEYLSRQFMIPHSFNVEKSKDNHFMFWKNGGGKRHKNWKPPTEYIYSMSFKEWLTRAKNADTNKLSNTSEHFYFHASERTSRFVSQDLQLFSTKTNNFFVSNVKANKGIQCRFGMRGVIAETHYDSGRNMVAMLRGAKRYILTPPWTCERLAIIADKSHPSYRHSVIDWSDMLQAKSSGFEKVDAIDTIVRRGEVLYIPTYWFHYIISLKYSIQCNSRSGFPPKQQGKIHIAKCMGW